MADRSINTTRQRILSLLARNPMGVPRAALHGVTGETPLIHQALQELIDEGVVTERLITSVRGKPRREYVLTNHLKAMGLQRVESTSREGVEALPGAKAIVEYIVNNYPGTSRSEMWAKAVVTKGWVSLALAELIDEGKIVEVLEEDVRGGLIRRYRPSNSHSTPQENHDSAKVRVAS